jgi:hypothetical protein
MDVESAINLFFKGVLLFPIFLFAGYVGLAMMKHMIFHGIPVMNNVTPEQQEVLRERDSQVGMPSSQDTVRLQPESAIQQPQAEASAPVSEISGAPEEITDVEWNLARLEFERDTEIWRQLYRAYTDCITYTKGECEYPQAPSMADYTDQYQ